MQYIMNQYIREPLNFQNGRNEKPGERERERVIEKTITWHRCSLHTVFKWLLNYSSVWQKVMNKDSLQ